MIHKRTLWLGSSLLLWGGTIVESFKILEDYSATPGFVPTIRHAWPIETALPSPPTDQSNVILFITPKCPCTRSSLSNLRTLLEQTQHIAKTAYVVFVTPSLKLVQDASWKMAVSIPGVIALQDDGTEARRFGALLSGHLFVYNKRGQLSFSGGITTCHEENSLNEGLSAAVEALSDSDNTVNRSRVFGCLFETNKKVEVSAR